MRIIRVILWIVGVLLLFIVVLAAGVYVASSSRLARTYSVPAQSLTVPTDAASIERGRHLAVAATHCTGCHGENLAGQVMVDAPPFFIVASNLTKGQGGSGTAYTDANLINAIRYGVRPDGRSLLLMPSGNFAELSDEDILAIVAYLKSVPPVDNALPVSALRPLGRALLIGGQLDVLSAEEAAQAPPRAAPIAPGATAAYGQYLVSVGGCQACHGPTLTGGMPPDGSDVPAPNITAKALSGWSEDGFIKAMREGVTPQGKAINEAMPWRAVGQLSDEELRAIWSHLQSVQ